LTPFPASNSTLSQASVQPSSITNTLTDIASPCESTTTSSSTCTDSPYYPSYSPSFLTTSTSTHCPSAAGGTTSPLPYTRAPTVRSDASSTCNTTSPMSSYGTAHWSSMTHRSNMTNTFGVKGL
jgi:hypothetical protein